MAFGNDPQAFPMMIVPLEVLIAMTRMQSHEELMDAGALVNFQFGGRLTPPQFHERK